MGLDRERIGEVSDAFFRAFRARPRLLFLAACLAVTAVSWWGMVRFADRLLAGLPASARTDVPVPLTATELARRATETARVDAALRAQRSAESGATGHAPQAIDSLVGGLGATGAMSSEMNSAATATVAADQPAEPVYIVKPDYPDLAAQAGAQGTVNVQALVGPDGAVLETRVLNSMPLLNQAAEAAARHWRFKPATAGGVPIASWVTIPLTFHR